MIASFQTMVVTADVTVRIRGSSKMRQLRLPGKTKHGRCVNRYSSLSQAFASIGDIHGKSCRKDVIQRFVAGAARHAIKRSAWQCR